MAFLKEPSPNGRPLATIIRVSGELTSDLGGAIAAVPGELISQCIDASRQVGHEGHRPLALRLSEFGVILAASDSFACELIQHRPNLALATTVRIDRLFVIVSGCAQARRLLTPEHRTHFVVKLPGHLLAFCRLKASGAATRRLHAEQRRKHVLMAHFRGFSPMFGLLPRRLVTG